MTYYFFGATIRNMTIVKFDLRKFIMRIAVAFEDGEIFQHFGHTKHFKFYDLENSKITKTEVVETYGSGHGLLAEFLNGYGTDILICGGIGSGAKQALANKGIDVFGGVKGSADDAVDAYINGTLCYNPDAKCNHSHSDNHKCNDEDCRHRSCL